INGLNWKLSDFQCSYDIPRTKKQIKELGPGSDRLELHYDEDNDQTRISGQPFDDSRHPRFENPYIKGGRVLWGQYHYTIQHKSHSLTHDFRELKDSTKSKPDIKRYVDSREHTPRAIEKIRCKPQYKVEGRGTSDSPSLAVGRYSNAQILYMVWKGVEDDSCLYFSLLIDNVWSQQFQIEGPGSSHSPSLVSYVGKGAFQSYLLMVWKGVEDDSGIYYSMNYHLGPSGWTPQKKIEGVGTSCRPALVVYHDTIYMAWKGVEDDSAIYYTHFMDDHWAPQRKIPGVGTSDSPALGVADDKLYMVWKGVEDDSNVYYSRYRQEWVKWEDQQVIRSTNAAGNKSSEIGTSHGPSITFLEDALLVAWKGVEDDSSMWFTTFERFEWTGQVNIKGIGTEHSPSVANMNDKLYLAWKGIEDDSGIYMMELGTKEEHGSGIFFLWPD
ncbi:MAG TPA: hypothetical protein VLH08_20955, partial [Acidobacteriota bacterium]|nr:hypothetical protein [Acidobacteriota bacterium]